MNDQYRTYFENMPCYISVQDRDLRILHANDRFRKDFGDPEGHHCYRLYKQRSEKCASCAVEQTFESGEEHRNEKEVITADGRTISVIMFTTPIRDDAGKIVSVMKMSADITYIKKLETRLRESQQHSQLLFDEVPCFISIQDPDLRITKTNRRFKEAFGAAIGEKCYEVYKHRTEECIPCSVKKTFLDGNSHHSEEVVTSIDGEQINTLVYSAPIRDESGRVTSVMEMSANITPVRKLQTQLESIGILISSISHGIKGMLTGLDGGMYLVNSGMEKKNQARIEKGWEMVQRNVDRIRSMVLNILYYAKEREPLWEAVDADALLAEVRGLTTARAVEHGITLNHASDTAAGTLEADAKALRSLLINLAENSIDACRVDEKKKEHEVSLSMRADADRVEFIVEDNGIGMDQETREKAFTIFFSSKGVEGTGLGLFIANNIAQAHGGAIEMTSEVDRGTRFKVILPRRRTV